MAQYLHCPHCTYPTVVAPQHRGREIRCRQCGTIFVVATQRHPEDRLIRRTGSRPAPHAP